MAKKGKTAGFVILLIAIIGGGGFAGWYFFWPKTPEQPDVSFEFFPIQINEIVYLSTDVNQEWIELYYFGTESLSLENWTLESANGTSLLLPDQIVNEFDYLAIHLGAKTG